jgi:predicted DNA-binding protein
MKKPKYLKTVCCPLTNEMFEKIMKITDEREIAISEFIRESIELKIHSMEESENGKPSM